MGYSPPPPPPLKKGKGKFYKGGGGVDAPLIGAEAMVGAACVEMGAF